MGGGSSKKGKNSITKFTEGSRVPQVTAWSSQYDDCRPHFCVLQTNIRLQVIFFHQLIIEKASHENNSSICYTVTTILETTLETTFGSILLKTFQKNQTNIRPVQAYLSVSFVHLWWLLLGPLCYLSLHLLFFSFGVFRFVHHCCSWVSSIVFCIAPEFLCTCVHSLYTC